MEGEWRFPGDHCNSTDGEAARLQVNKQVSFLSLLSSVLFLRFHDLQVFLLHLLCINVHDQRSDKGHSLTIIILRGLLREHSSNV